MNQELKAVFLAPFHARWPTLSPDEQATINRLASDHTADLSATQGRNFSPEVQRQIAMQAAHRFEEISRSQPLSQAWNEVVRDFHRNGAWGFQSERATFRLPRASESSREIFSYFWAVFQAMVLTKIGIIYFGSHSIEDFSPWAKVALFGVLSFTFCSLVWFAVSRARRDPDSGP